MCCNGNHSAFILSCHLTHHSVPLPSTKPLPLQPAELTGTYRAEQQRLLGTALVRRPYSSSGSIVKTFLAGQLLRFQKPALMLTHRLSVFSKPSLNRCFAALHLLCLCLSVSVRLQMFCSRQHKVAEEFLANSQLSCSKSTTTKQCTVCWDCSLQMVTMFY